LLAMLVAIWLWSSALSAALAITSAFWVTLLLSA
jgi:hypothetical protein